MASLRDAFRGTGRARVRATTRLLGFALTLKVLFVGSFGCVRCANIYLVASTITMLIKIQNKILVQNAKYLM
jgi:hypothetical protein